MNLTTKALANLHSENRQGHVSRYIEEQIALHNSHRDLGESFADQRKHLDVPGHDLDVWTEGLAKTVDREPSHRPTYVPPQVNNTCEPCPEDHHVTTCTTSKLPESSYQKRGRHKMREDSVRVPMDSSKALKGKGTKKVSSGSRSRSKVKKVKRVKRLVASSIVEDNTRARLTLKPHHSLGLFKNGRASAQVEKRGLPDLTFCEMKFLQGSDRNKSISAEPSESSNSPNLSEMTPHFSSNPKAGTTDRHPIHFCPSMPHLVDHKAVSIVPLATNSVTNLVNEVPIQQNLLHTCLGNSQPHVPSEAPPLTERKLFTDIESNQERRVVVSSEDSSEERSNAEHRHEQQLGLQQAQPDTSIKVHDKKDSRWPETPGRVSYGEVVAGGTEGGSRINGEDLVCQGIKDLNSKRETICPPSPLLRLLHACDDLLSNELPLATFPIVDSLVSGRVSDSRSESPRVSSPLIPSSRQIYTQNSHAGAESHPQDIPMVVEYSTTERADRGQNQGESFPHWYIPKRSDAPVEQYLPLRTEVQTQYEPTILENAATEIEIAYPSCTMEPSQYKDHEVPGCSKKLYGNRSSVWNAGSDIASIHIADHNKDTLGLVISHGTDIYERVIRDGYGYGNNVENLESQLQLEDSRSLDLDLIELEEGFDNPIQDNEDFIDFCWRPYWRS